MTSKSYDQMKRKLHRQMMENHNDKQDDTPVDRELAYQERIKKEKQLIRKLNLKEELYPHTFKEESPEHEEWFLCSTCFYAVGKQLMSTYGFLAIFEANRMPYDKYGCERCLYEHHKFNHATIRIVIRDLKDALDCQKEQVKILERLLVKQILDEV